MAANANIGRIFAELGIDTTIGTDLARARGQLSAGLSGLAGGSVSALGTVATTIGAVGLAAGAMAATVGGVAVNSFKNFEQSVTNAASVLGLTGDAFQQARNNIAAVSQELGQKTVYSSSDAADALYNLASAGVDVAHVTAAQMQPALDLAAGTQYDLAGTTELVASTMSQFGISFSDSSRIADVYAMAIGKSQANMEKLAVSMNYAGPAMAGVNGSLEDTTAILSTLYNAGLSAEMAGTGVRTMIASLLDPTSSANAALEEMGLTTEQVNPELNSMTNIISLLGSRGMTMAQAIAIFGREGANAALIATQNSGALQQLAGDLKNAGGAAGTIAAQQMDTLAGSLENLKGTYENVLINIGKAKAPDLRNLFSSLADAAPQVEAFALAIVGFISDLTSRLTPAVGLIQEIGQTIITTFQGIVSQLGGGNLAAGIANLVTRTLDAVRIVIQAAAPYVQAAVVGIVTFIRSLVSQLGPAWASLQTIGAGIKTIFSNLFSSLSGGAGGGSGLASGLAGIINTVTAFIARIITVFAQISTQAAPVIQAGISAIMTGLRSLGTILAPVISAVGAVIARLPAVFATVAPYLQAAYQRIQGVLAQLPAVFQGITTRLQPIWTQIKGVMDQAPAIFSGIVERLRPIWTRISAIWDQLPALFERVRPNLEKAWGWLSNVFKNLWQVAQDFVNNLGPTWDNLKSIWDSLVIILQTAWEALQPLFAEIKTQWSKFFDTVGGKDAGKGSGIGSTLAGLVNSLSGAIAGLLKWVSGHPEITTFATQIVTAAGWIIAALPATILAIWNFATGAAEWLGQAVTAAQEFYNRWSQRWTDLKTATANAANAVWQQLLKWYNDLVNVYNQVQNALEALRAWLAAKWDAIKAAIQAAADAIWQQLLKWYNDLLNVYNQAQNALQTLYTFLQNTWNQILTAITTAANAIWQQLLKWYNDLLNVYNQAQAALEALRAWLAAKWEEIKTMIQAAATAVWQILVNWYNDLVTVYNQVQAALDTLKQYMFEKWEEVKQIFTDAKDRIIEKLQELVTDAKTEIENLKNGILSTLDGIVTAIEDKAGEWYDAGKKLAQSLADGLKGAYDSAVAAVTGGNEEVDAQLPHSPAKKGVFRRLPNWDAVMSNPIKAGIAKIASARSELQTQMSSLKKLMTFSQQTPGLNLTGNLAGVTAVLHKLLDTPKTESSSSSTSSGTTKSGGVWSKTTTSNGTTTTTSGTMTQAQAQALLAKMEKLIQAQAPQITIKDVKLDKEYNFEKLVSDVEKYQAAQRRQRGAYI